MEIEGIRIPGREDRATKFEFQYRDGGDWKTIFSADKIGGNFHKKFAPVKAQEFRLNILDSFGSITIGEIELLEKQQKKGQFLVLNARLLSLGAFPFGLRHL